MSNAEAYPHIHQMKQNVAKAITMNKGKTDRNFIYNGRSEKLDASNYGSSLLRE